MQIEPDVELLVAASSAIQRLIAERKVLRERVITLEHELQTLRSRTILVNDSYHRLTDEFVTQFKLINNAVSDLLQEPAAPVTKDAAPDTEQSTVAA